MLRPAFGRRLSVKRKFVAIRTRFSLVLLACGVDYDSSWGSQELMELYIKEQIKQVPGVNKIDSFSIKKISNDTEQYFQIDTIVKFEGEVLEISELIGV